MDATPATSAITAPPIPSRSGSRPPSAGVLPTTLTATSAAARATEKRMAPTASSRPGRPGVSQPALAAQARARAAIPMGTLT